MKKTVTLVMLALLVSGVAAAADPQSTDTAIVLSQNTVGDTLGGILSIFTGTEQQLTEVEPNNSPDQANGIRLDENVVGLIHMGDYDRGDYYTFTPASSGTVTVTVSGFPSECRMTVGALGFQRDTRAPVRPEQTRTSLKGESSLVFSFPVTGGYPGYVFVSGPVIEGSSFSGRNWNASQCSRKGDYYLHPQQNDNPRDVPRTYNNRKVLMPIQYQLTASLRAETARTESKEAPSQSFGLPKSIELENKRTYSPSRSFAPDENLIHASFTYKGLTPGAKLKTVWYYIENQDQPYKVHESEPIVIREPAGYADFPYELSKDKKWPKGRYRIDVMLDNVKIDEITFRVKDQK